MRPQNGQVDTTLSLDTRILQDCATQGVESAQKIISIVIEDYAQDENARLLPWWYRVFYLYIAMQQLVAAMMQAQIFQPLVSDCWEKAMSALCAHEYLSPCLTRCTASFRKMWQRVANVRGPTIPESSEFSSQDVLHHLGLEHVDEMLNLEGLEDVDWNWFMPLFENQYNTSGV